MTLYIRTTSGRYRCAEPSEITEFAAAIHTARLNSIGAQLRNPADSAEHVAAILRGSASGDGYADARVVSVE